MIQIGGSASVGVAAPLLEGRLLGRAPFQFQLLRTFVQWKTETAGSTAKQGLISANVSASIGIANVLRPNYTAR